MTRTFIFLFGLGAAVAAGVSCSADARHHEFGSGGGDPTGTGTDSTGTLTTSSVGEGVGGGFNPASGSGGGNPGCGNPANTDGDKDGWTGAEGDCNDCDPNVNPGAVETINADPAAPKSDEDCDGTADNPVDTCDGFPVDDTDAYHGANAMDICQKATLADKKWGMLDASYVRANGTKTAGNLQVGILGGFGPQVNVQGGQNLLMLSSGHSRVPGQADECLQQSCSENGPGIAPNGFPQDVPNCSGSTNINDDIGLEVKLRTPTNATGYEFYFKFHSFEFPEWVCTSYNDQFIALVNPPPMGSINGNISFDSNKNPVSVNIAFFDVCDPNGIGSFASLCFAGCPAPPNPYCPSGPGELSGTGFDAWGDAGGTSWLKTQAPVTGGGEIVVRFAIWDTGDTALDSSVLLDKFRWIANGGQVAVGTEPVPDPN